MRSDIGDTGGHRKPAQLVGNHWEPRNLDGRLRVHASTLPPEFNCQRTPPPRMLRGHHYGSIAHVLTFSKIKVGTSLNDSVAKSFAENFSLNLNPEPNQSAGVNPPSLGTIQLENVVMQIEPPFCRAKREMPQRKIKSLNGEQPVNAPKESLLPKGLEPLGKRRKECGRSHRPARAERAGASESLG